MGSTYSPQDRDIAIRTVLGEAGDQGQAGMSAVANVIKNRQRAGFGNSLSEVALAPGQFEPWQRNPDRLLNISQNSPQYQEAAKVVDGVLSGQTPDNSGGATHFFAPQLQSDLGRNVPSWAKSFTPTATIGGHSFYQDPKFAGTLGTPEQTTQATQTADATQSQPSAQPQQIAAPSQPQQQAGLLSSMGLGNGTSTPLLGGILGVGGQSIGDTSNDNAKLANAAMTDANKPSPMGSAPLSSTPRPQPVDLASLAKFFQQRRLG